jgi:hypothetical protein
MLKVEKNNGALVSNKILNYDSFFKRALGLMFKTRDESYDGIMLSPCSNIHTFFMRMEIDCFFLSGEGKILKIIWRMKPSKISGFIKNCHSVLELVPGVVETNSLTEGEYLKIEPLK